MKIYASLGRRTRTICCIQNESSERIRKFLPIYEVINPVYVLNKMLEYLVTLFAVSRNTTDIYFSPQNSMYYFVC